MLVLGGITRIAKRPNIGYLGREIRQLSWGREVFEDARYLRVLQRHVYERVAFGTIRSAQLPSVIRFPCLAIVGVENSAETGSTPSLRSQKEQPALLAKPGPD